MHKKIITFLFIFFSIAAFLVFRPFFSIFYFQNDNNKISVNIESKIQDDIYICFDDNCSKMQFKNGVYTYKLNQENELFYIKEVKNIALIFKKPNIKINALSVFTGKKLNYIQNIDKLKIKQTQFQGQKAYLIDIPYQTNGKTLIQKIGVYIESIFYNWYFWFFSYVLAFIYFIKFKPKIKTKHLICLIIFLGFILRLSHIDFIPLWNDELYTFCFISDLGQNINLKRTILDPGNPPLFFILANIWFLFFNKSIFSIRFLALIIGLVQIYSIYYILKKVLNKKTALISAFLSAINIFIILESNEIRSYILSMVLILWNGYFFYRLRHSFSNINILIYTLFSILLINTHYYCILYVFANFILGLILFKNKRIAFLLSNVFAFLTFIPYLQTTVIYKSFCDDFNVWLEKPTLEVIKNHITFYFGNIIFMVVSFVFCFWLIGKLKDRYKKVFIYNVYIIVFVFIFAYLISIFSKPILFERYFCIFLPLLIINTSMAINFEYKYKIIPLIVFIFSINIPKYENFNLFSNIDSQVQYFQKDYKNNKNSYFIMPDNIRYAYYYKDLPVEKIIVSNYGIRQDIDLINNYLSKIKQKENIVLYIPEICTNLKIKQSKELNIKKINTAIMPLYKVYIN